MRLVRCPSDEERLIADTCSIAKKPYNEEEVIATYKKLIRSMPRANQYLLLYVLDLLSVFARKSDKNLMTAKSASFHVSPASSDPHRAAQFLQIWR